MEYLDIDGNKYEITGYADDGLPVIKGVAETITDGFDGNGNLKQSVTITVPAASLLGTPGEN